MTESHLLDGRAEIRFWHFALSADLEGICNLSEQVRGRQ